MFVGAPCEVAGLKNYIMVEEPNLLCVDFLCKGPTSPLFIKDYVKAEEKKKGAHITYLNMRYNGKSLIYGFLSLFVLNSAMENKN